MLFDGIEDAVLKRLQVMLPSHLMGKLLLMRYSSTMLTSQFPLYSAARVLVLTKKIKVRKFTESNIWTHNK
jgi:hypothetical protein